MGGSIGAKNANQDFRKAERRSSHQMAAARSTFGRR